jgi:beta-mannosidase
MVQRGLVRALEGAAIPCARFYAPVAVAALRDTAGHTTVSLLNDRPHAVRGELRLRVMTVDGKLLREERKPVELAPLSATRMAEYADADLLAGAAPASTIAAFDLQVVGEPAARGVVISRPQSR